MPSGVIASVMDTTGAALQYQCARDRVILHSGTVDPA